MIAPTTYHGVWQVPDARGMYTRQFSGTLTYYGDKPSILELIHEPNFVSISNNAHYDVLWGQDATGMAFTIFDAILVHQANFTKTTFKVNFFLVGAHINSLEEPFFDTCISFFPYLRNWAFNQRFDVNETEKGVAFQLNMVEQEPLTSVNLEEGLKAYAWGKLSYHTTRFGLSAEQITTFNIEAAEKASIRDYLAIISEFAEFLSLALFSPQHPSGIQFKNKGDERSFILLFKVQPSVEPMPVSLIKFDKLKDRVPALLQTWHSKHEQAVPIANYLIRSMRYDTPFDAPDFLIIAQASTVISNVSSTRKTEKIHENTRTVLKNS